MGREAERAARVAERRATWSVGPLTDDTPGASGSFEERCRELERLRRIAWALMGRTYPEGPTTKEERRSWPVERIG